MDTDICSYCDDQHICRKYREYTGESCYRLQKDTLLTKAMQCLKEYFLLEQLKEGKLGDEI